MIEKWYSFLAPLPKGSRKRLDIRYNSVRLKVRPHTQTNTMKGGQGTAESANAKEILFSPLGKRM